MHQRSSRDILVRYRHFGLVPSAVLLPLLAIILVLSTVKVWKRK